MSPRSAITASKSAPAPPATGDEPGELSEWKAEGRNLQGRNALWIMSIIIRYLIPSPLLSKKNKAHMVIRSLPTRIYCQLRGETVLPDATSHSRCHITGQSLVRCVRPNSKIDWRSRSIPAPPDISIQSRPQRGASGESRPLPETQFHSGHPR